MRKQPLQRTLKLTIIAQDPMVRVRGRILTARVEVPAESLAAGPTGYRVQVIDYDASTNTLYKPRNSNLDGDPFFDEEKQRVASDRALLGDPQFHAQNVYAIIMRTLARFEFALGRHVGWGFQGHQILVAPHAFAEANAFYSESDRGLMFGYFPRRDGKGTVFSCLSHDVIAHETTHALLDGLREYFTDPSSPEQAAFHEGFSDVVALLSVFSLPNVVETLLDLQSPGTRRISRKKLTEKELRQSILIGLADEMGQELSGVRGRALRNSAELVPSPDYIEQPEFLEPHRRGEIFVAAMMNAFLRVWAERLKGLGDETGEFLDRKRVAEEGADAAEYLLTMSIRALDYTPPVHLEFCDFLSAILTSDREVNPSESRFRFRDVLLESFAAYGMKPASRGRTDAPGVWLPPRSVVSHERTHFASMQHDPEEVFRFAWENRRALKLYSQAYSRVQSVRPSLRIGPDGFPLRETVAEVVQILRLRASELGKLGIKAPQGMPDNTPVTLRGGCTLIFDEYGQLKFSIHNRVHNAPRQTRRLKFLWEYGFFSPEASALRRFSHMHRQRVHTGRVRPVEEVW